MAQSDELDLSDLKAQAEQLLIIYQQQTAELQKQAQVAHTALSGKGMPTSVDGIQRENAAKKEAMVIDGQLTQKKKEQIAAQQILNQLSKTERDNIKASTSAYSALSVAYGKALQKAKDLAAADALAGKAKSAATNAAIKEAESLNNKLKGIDASMGNYQRNVGNYSNAIRPLTEVIEGLGRAFGLPVEGLREYSGALRGSLHLHEQAAAGAKAQTAANEEEGASWMAALGPIALVIGAIAAVTAGIGIYIAESKKSAQEERDRSVAMDGTIIVDKALRKEYNEHVIAIKSLNNSYKVLNGTMTEYDAKLSDLKEHTKADLSELQNDTTEKLQKVNGFWNTLKNGFLDTITLSAYGTHTIKESLIDIAEAGERADAIMEKANDEMFKEELDALKSFGEQIDDIYEEIAMKRASRIKNEEERFKATQKLKENEEIEKVRKGALQKDEQDLLIAAIHKKYAEEQADFDDDMAEKKKEKDEQRYKDAAEKRKEAYDNSLRAAMDYNNKVLAIFKDRLAKQKQEFADNQGKGYDLDIESAEMDVSEKSKGKDYAGTAQAKNKLAQLKAMKALRAVYADKTLNPENVKKNEVNINRRLNDEIIANNKEALEKEYNDSVAAEKKQEELIQKKKDAEIKAQEDTLQALGQALDAQNQMQQQALKTQTQMIQNEAQVQATLAAQGRQNTLAQTMAAENQAAEQQLQLQRQQQQRKEAMELANLFISAESAYIKGGASPTKAAAEALSTVLLAKGIAAGLAGAFFEGTPDTGGPGRLDDRGGMLAVLHPHEAVIPRDKNEQYPGLAKAWIQGNLDTYLAQLAMPAPQADNLNEVKKELTEIKEVLKKQPWGVAYSIDGKAVVEEHTGEGKKTRVINESPVIRII